MPPFRIAVAGEYRLLHDFIRAKWGVQITGANKATNTYELANGVIVQACYGEPNQYLSVVFDACIILPSCPVHLAIMINGRCLPR